MTSWGSWARHPGWAWALVLGLGVHLAGCSDDETLVAGGVAADGASAADVAALADGGADGVTPPGDTSIPPADVPSDNAAPTDGIGADVPVDDAAADVAVDVAPPDTGPACKPDHCLIGTECIANGQKHPKNPCLRCIVVTDPSQWSADDGGTDGNGGCDDGDSCTVADHCAGGQCQGSGKVCSDGNPCTTDSCDLAAGCTFTANDQPCDDGNACTLGDTCTATTCGAGVGKPKCDDGNLCTDDGCDPKLGCTLANNATPCDDGEVCTTADACKDGQCVGGPALACDDQDVCTIDSCTPKAGCAHKSIAALCVDENPCTDEACDKQKGCVFPFNTKPCDDKNLCTQLDTCSSGACVGAPITFDDANLCTDDSCDPGVGPVHVPNTLGCDDGDVCTLDDTCGGAKCLPGKSKKVCDDGNVCTDDGCNPQNGCTIANNVTPCDDGTVCTQSDTCGDGKCKGTAISCDDGNACTTDSCDPKSGCKHDLIVSNACRPIIDVEYPPRAATIQQPSQVVTVKGKVKSGAGPISKFTINGKDVVPGADGSFSLDLMAKAGGNALVLTAQDSFGSTKQRVQAFLWSSTYFKPQKAVADSGMVDPGLAFWLSQQVIDDGNHAVPPPPNDLATIFELYLASLDIGKMLPNPVYKGSLLITTVTVTASNVKNAPAKVTLKPGPNSTLVMTATMTNVSADLQADAGFLGKPTGKLTIGSIVINATLQLSVDKATHKLVIKTVSSSATLDNVTIANFTGVFGFLINLLGPLIVGAVKPQLESSINNSLQSQIGPALANALGALALNASFDIKKLDGSDGKVTLTLQTDFSDVAGDTPGIAFLERARVVTDKANSYDNLGVPGRVGCALAPQKMVVPKKDPLELVIADDTFNQILYGTWLGGLFEFPVPASMLGNVDLGAYGVTDLKLKVSAMLAPTMDDCANGGALDAFIGDFKVDANMKLFGQQMDVVVYATFTAGIEIKATGSAIGIALSALKTSALQVDVQQDNLVGSEAVLQKLIGDTLLNNLVGQLGGDALGSFPIPAIDLSKAMPTLPPGTVLAIDSKNVTRQGGNTIVGGNLK